MVRRFAGIAVVIVAVVADRSLAGSDADLSSSGQALAADPSLPLAALFAGGTGGGLVPTEHRISFDFNFGPYIPLEGDDQEFDVGGTTSMKIQGEVVRYFFVGGEFAYAGHTKEASDLFFEGTLHRFFFLVPLEVDLPFAGHEENPFSIRFGVAPGIQLVDPVVDEDVEEYFEYVEGLHPREDTEVAFNVRARVGLRLPIDPHFGFVFEVAYDWAETKMSTDFKDLMSGASVDRRKETVDLSGLSVLLGFAFVW